MMDDVKAEEGEEGEVDENGLPVTNKRVSRFFLTLVLRVFSQLIWIFPTLSISVNCRRPAAWTGDGGELEEQSLKTRMAWKMRRRQEILLVAPQHPAVELESAQDAQLMLW